MIGDALRWKSQLRYFEEIFYQLTLCYMYILNHLLRFKFDIDKAMRAKLVWKLHSKREVKNVPIISCLFVYMLDTKSMIESIFDFSYRNKEIIKCKDEYFWIKRWHRKILY